jgi:cysteine desulfurase
MRDRIYLDHAATTPARSEVIEAMLPYFGEVGHNPSSLHVEGRRARAALDEARDRVARILGVHRKTITFTGSGSEADNQALVGAIHGLGKRGANIISVATEHHAILHALDALHDDGYSITILPVDDRGLVDPDSFAHAMRSDTVLASVMLANNELGTIQPIARLAQVAREHHVLFHTDAVQAGAWLDVSPETLGVDMLSLSAHKFYGPKGVGMLYVREGVNVTPLVFGGGQEFGRRSGTENVAGIVGFARALEMVAANRDARSGRVSKLRDALENGLSAKVQDIRVNGAGAERLPNISNVSFAGIDSESLLMRLDLEGVAVSAGSACTSGALEPSHVIAALGTDARWHQGVIRFSLGEATSASDVEYAVALVSRLATELRAKGVRT